MAYVKIKFEPLLWVVQADTRGMYSIGYCLTDDISYGRGYKRIDWLLDDRYDTACSNRTFMEKDKERVIVGDLLTEDSCEAAISVPVAAMIDLLQQWDVICKTNPEEVTIHYEHEKFSIEAKPRVPDKQDALMGRYVEIKKIKEEDNACYYSVQSPDYTDIPPFYIKINAPEQTVVFYKNLSDHNAELIVRMGRDIDRSPDWLPSFLVYATLKKAWEALKNHKFDDFISFQS